MKFSTTVLPILALLDTCTSNCKDTAIEDDAADREKRWLTFKPNGGLAKLTLGLILPVVFSDFKLVRNLVTTNNVQANYVVPEDIDWPVPEAVFKQRLNSDFVDDSRRSLYKFLEGIQLNSGDSNGKECLLRTICEIAEAPLGHNGMFGEILDVLFTPYNTDNVDEAYKAARINGLTGGDCAVIYKLCPPGSGLLEKMSFLHLQK